MKSDSNLAVSGERSPEEYESFHSENSDHSPKGDPHNSKRQQIVSETPSECFISDHRNVTLMRNDETHMEERTVVKRTSVEGVPLALLADSVGPVTHLDTTVTLTEITRETHRVTTKVTKK